MPAILKFFQVYFPPSVIRKLATFAILFGLGFLVQDFLVLFFITFIFAYLFLEVGETLAHRIHSWGHEGKKDTPHMIAAKYATTNTVVTILYIVFVMVLIFIFVNILPKISLEIGEFIRKTGDITRNASELVRRIEGTLNLSLGLDRIVGEYINSANIEALGQKIISYIRDGGIILVKFFLALVLSYIFIFERKQIEVFLQRIRRGNFSFFYEEGAIVAKKVGKGFGIIFRAQSIIALVNTIITSVGLLIIGVVAQGTAFPYIVTLALLVFIFGFVPVFGTFLSSIPIIILGYGLGGWPVMIACIIMVLVVHAVEAYYLNPKIVSAYVHFPVFVTFVILLLAEHFFGLIGLLIGVPVVSILIDFIEDIDKYIDDVRTRLHG